MSGCGDGMTGDLVDLRRERRERQPEMLKQQQLRALVDADRVRERESVERRASLTVIQTTSEKDT